MDVIYWIWLATLPYIGPILQKRLIEYYKTPEVIFDSTEQDLKKIPRISSLAITSIIQNRTLDKAKQIYEKLERKQIKLLTYVHPEYPHFAKICPESPVVLYYKGHLKPYEHSVGIVGSRRCTLYGRKISTFIATELSKLRVPIISGMAKGVDGYAQTAALQNAGETLAFLASGVDICYPKEHQILYEKIIENGAVISQYPPETRAHPKHFLQRNALISAWSKQLIVVEAGEKSGALTTVHFSQKYNRDIFAVPNQIDIPEGKGTNDLLKSGVKPFLGIESLNLPTSQSEGSPKRIDKLSDGTAGIQRKTNFTPTGDTTQTTRPADESSILNFLQQGPLNIADIHKKIVLEKDELDELLFLMELEGKLKIRGEFVSITY